LRIWVLVTCHPAASSGAVHAPPGLCCPYPQRASVLSDRRAQQRRHGKWGIGLQGDVNWPVQVESPRLPCRVRSRRSLRKRRLTGSELPQPRDESRRTLIRILFGIPVPGEPGDHSSEDRNRPASGARRSSEQAGETPSVSSPGCEATLQPTSSARRQRRSIGPISVCLQRTVASTARSDDRPPGSPVKRG
jgi:hypothetical protein